MADGDWSDGVNQLADAFEKGGGKTEAWNRLYLRTDLEDGLFDKLEAGEPAGRFKETVERILAVGDLILYEVKDADLQPKGPALARVLEIFKHTKSEFTLKIRFLASEDPDFAAWARETFNETQDCRLHLCGGLVDDCRVKSRSKTTKFAHTDSWRICSYRAVMRSPWAGAAALEDLSIMVSRWLRDHGIREGAEAIAVPAGDEADFDLMLGEGEPEPPGERGSEAARSPSRRDLPAQGAGRPTEGKAHIDAQEGGRKAMQALRGASPQLLPGVVGEARRVVRDEGRLPKELDPRKAAAPKPAPKVNLVAAEVRGQEPWMDDVSVTEGVGGYGPGEDGEDRLDRKRKREASMPRDQIAKDKRQDYPGEPGRGGFFDGGQHQETSRRHKKKRKKEKKRRRRATSSSSSRSDEEASSAGSLYGKDKHRHTPLADKAKKKPGRLLKSGLEEMAKYLARRLGEGSHEVGSSWRLQRVGAYVSQVLMVQHPAERMGPRNSREIQTLSLAIDALMDGQYALCGDYLMQRLKAVESSLTDGWKVAEQQEIVPPARASLTSDAERSFAARRAVAAQKLQDVVKKTPR